MVFFFGDSATGDGGVVQEPLVGLVGSSSVRSSIRDGVGLGVAGVFGRGPGVLTVELTGVGVCVVEREGFGGVGSLKRPPDGEGGRGFT